MRILLVNSNVGGSSVTAGPGGTIEVKSSNAGPKFTLALLVLVGFCALIGVAWIFFRIFRICRPQQPQRRTPSATISAGLSAHPRDGSWHHRSSASLSGPFSDLERADTADSLTVAPRSDSMVTRASAWARAILSGEQPSPQLQPLSSTTTSTKAWDTVSIPVKQAVVIMQPDGEATLGISEAKQKDVMVQVDEEDLYRESTGAAGCSSRNDSRTGAAVPSRHRRGGVVDEASQCPSQYSRESSRTHLEEATTSDLTPPPPSYELDDQPQQQQRQRRRRRKRRKGTCEASCQTDESSLQ